MLNNRIGCSKLPCFCCLQYWWMYYDGPVDRGRDGLVLRTSNSNHIYHGMDYCDSWAAPDLGKDDTNARAASELYKTFGNAFFMILQLRGLLTRGAI
ncbi:hypothetical protein BOTBODRAFT_37773 [Botryobasidium botryosum FD-172 SS1]|uniref:Uncharacterized protein n=1 Tax=Botryobasidium botryosum (strain FD-172 SS1) TaxID=930990 RepID=A0A067M9S2_BOTB1|nr:hypothetical protein BOTBODRAFT_37773 [Botryobasidium botryosum FD-172 SS1]